MRRTKNGKNATKKRKGPERSMKYPLTRKEMQKILRTMSDDVPVSPSGGPASWGPTGGFPVAIPARALRDIPRYRDAKPGDVVVMPIPKDEPQRPASQQPGTAIRVRVEGEVPSPRARATRPSSASTSGARRGSGKRRWKS